MKKHLAATGLLFVLTASGVASERRDADLDRLHSAGTILNQIMSAPDSAIPDAIMDGAKCIAILPSTLKGGFIVGAAYGKGVATCRTDKGWSAPAFFKLTGGSFGFQAGGQASDLVLIIRTDEGMQHLLQSKFKLGADASAAAGPVGRDASAATDLTLRAQVLTYSRSRGLFLGVSLNGAVMNQDQADTQAFYGKGWNYRALLNGQVSVPQDATPLLQTVEKYAPTRKPHATAAPTPTASAPAAPAPTASAPTAATPTPAAEPETSSTGASRPATADAEASSSSAMQSATAEPAAPASSETAAEDPATASTSSSNSTRLR